MLEEPKPKKRTVKKAEYRIEVQTEDSVWVAAPDAPEVPDTVAGIAWIKKMGNEGETYRVVRVCFGPKTIKIETVKKRTFD